ncbi:MAG: DNA-3-methyladenine glycosylase [Paraglaciecola sp.]|jgi:DNA-3-methyladenine glycosylase
MKKLPKSFYTRTDVLQISKDLLGKHLVTNFDGQRTVGKIVETEAYRAPDDKACHAHLNRFTKRTKVMFEEGGVAYVYLCYGIHHLFNIVTAKEGMAHAILVRGIEPVENIELMMERRGMDKLKPQLTAGPGVLSKAMGITKAFTGMSLVNEDAAIWIADSRETIPEKNIICSPRVGIDYAEECALWDWRFRIKGNKWASKAK